MALATPINNFATTIASAYTAGSGTMTLASGSGLSTLTGSNWYRVSTFTSTGTPVAIYKVTGYSGGTNLTGLLAIEGTTDTNLSVGALVQIVPTAGSLSDIQALVGVSIGNAVTSGTANSALFVDASGNLGQDNSSYTYATSTHMLTSAQQTIAYTNTNYTNTAGAGSHILLTNPSSTGQNVLCSSINGSLCAKWRTDYSGNVNWCSFSGYHAFYTGGDNGTGNCHFQVANNGTAWFGTISNPSVSGFNAQVEIDTSSTGTKGLIVKNFGTQSVNMVEYQNSSGTAQSGVTKTGDLFLSATSGAPADSPAVGTMRFDTSSNLKIYVYNGTGWHYATLT